MSLNVLFKNSFPQSYQVAQRLSEMGFIHILTNILIYAHAKYVWTRLSILLRVWHICKIFILFQVVEVRNQSRSSYIILKKYLSC